MTSAYRKIASAVASLLNFNAEHTTAVDARAQELAPAYYFPAMERGREVAARFPDVAEVQAFASMVDHAWPLDRIGGLVTRHALPNLAMSELASRVLLPINPVLDQLCMCSSPPESALKALQFATARGTRIIAEGKAHAAKQAAVAASDFLYHSTANEQFRPTNLDAALAALGTHAVVAGEKGERFNTVVAKALSFVDRRMATKLAINLIGPVSGLLAAAKEAGGMTEEALEALDLASDAMSAIAEREAEAAAARLTETMSVKAAVVSRLAAELAPLRSDGPLARRLAATAER